MIYDAEKITLDDIFSNLNKRIIIKGKYKNILDKWNNGGIICPSFTIPFNQSLHLPEKEKIILIEGVLKPGRKEVTHPLVIELKCFLQNEYYILDNRTINELCKTNLDDIDAGFKQVISKLEQRKRPRILLLHPHSTTSKDDVTSAMAQSLNYFIIDNAELIYNSDDEEQYINSIKQYDKEQFDAICFISGGNNDGYGLLHKENIIKTILSAHTPLIGAVGHSNENHIFYHAFKRNFGTPSLLGTYLKELSIHYLH